MYEGASALINRERLVRAREGGLWALKKGIKAVRYTCLLLSFCLSVFFISVYNMYIQAGHFLLGGMHMSVPVPKVGVSELASK